MGSLSSRPKAPKKPKVVFVSKPAVSSVTQAESGSSSSSETKTDQAPEQALAEERTASLLKRDRGRFGTVQTGFRGFLGVSDEGSQRKTLLGE